MSAALMLAAEFRHSLALETENSSILRLSRDRKRHSALERRDDDLAAQEGGVEWHIDGRVQIVPNAGEARIVLHPDAEVDIATGSTIAASGSLTGGTNP